MSKPRIQVNVYVDTLVHATTLMGQIQTRVLTKDIFELAYLGTAPAETLTELIFDARLNNLADRDDVRAYIEDAFTKNPARNWVIRGKITWHECSHDSVPVMPCDQTQYAEWVK